MTDKRFTMFLNTDETEIGIKENRSGEVLTLKNNDFDTRHFIALIITFLNEQDDTIKKLVQDAEYWEKHSLERIKELEEENKKLNEEKNSLIKMVDYFHNRLYEATIGLVSADTVEELLEDDEEDLELTEKRFEYCMYDGFMDNDEYLDNVEVQNLLNEFNNENEKLKKENNRLKKENKEYHTIVNCHNCIYQDYDYNSCSDEEFEICEKGNTERMIYNRFCKEWADHKFKIN